MIKHNGEYYGWNAVYLISGLVQEDFLHDSVGSWEHFIHCLENCLEKWEDGNDQMQRTNFPKSRQTL